MSKCKITLKQVEESISELNPSEALKQLYILRENQELNLDRLIEKYLKKEDSFKKEKVRFNNMCKYESEAYKKGFKYIAGIDEAGRGPLAGPVVAAVVILPENIFINNLKDSKKLSPKQRDELYEQIKNKALAFEIGMADEKSIDDINIFNATKKAMEQAVNSLKLKPDILLIDAMKLDNLNISQISITKGDNLSISIAAASIIAKVTRDRIIEEYDNIYPQYGFAKHKGYGTKEHIEAIKKYGICPIHRISFVKNFI